MPRNASSEALSRRLAQIPEEILIALRPVLAQGAEDVASNMRSLAEASRQTGDLINSIEVTAPGGTTAKYAAGGGSETLGPNMAAVTVGNPDMRHGHLVEFGTVHSEPKPFMLPAFRLAKRKVEGQISRAIGKAIHAMGGA
ncbi:MAG: HK97 gp10 family phage protein [Loktanella salsilacus]|jgi:HK97 gp10 family phage protein